MPKESNIAVAEQKRQLEQEEYHAALDIEKKRIEQKNKYHRLNRCINVLRRELESAQTEQTRNQDAALLERHYEQETNLAAELSKLKREEMKEMLLRQQLRENCPELRELASKLKTAYVTKEIAAQIAEKQAERIREKLKQKEEFETLLTARIKEEEYLKDMKQEEILTKAKYKQELQDQIILQEKNRRYMYDEFLKEKKMIDDVIQRIHLEDQREMEERMLKMKRTREEMIMFKEAQEQWRKKRRDELEQENIKIQQYLLSKASDIQKRMEDKQKKEAVKEQIADRMAREMYAEYAKQKERNDIIQELLEEEHKEAMEKRHQQEVEKKIRQRLEMCDSLRTQLEEKQERLRQEAVLDAKFKAELTAKIIEDQRLEQLSEQKKRMKMLQVRRDVEQMMQERRQKRAEDLQMLIKLKERDDREMKERQRIIEEERIKMLQEHVRDLIGYLPPGILKPEDLPLLGSDLVR